MARQKNPPLQNEDEKNADLEKFARPQKPEAQEIIDGLAIFELALTDGTLCYKKDMPQDDKYKLCRAEAKVLTQQIKTPDGMKINCCAVTLAECLKIKSCAQCKYLAAAKKKKAFLNYQIEQENLIWMAW